MRCITDRRTLFALLISVAMLNFPVASGQPVRDRILDAVTVEEGQKADTIHIGLSIRVRYLSHFPYQSSNELRIRIRPFGVRTDDREALFERESLVPSGAPTFLREVVYEGDMEGGPFLTLFFSQEAEYEVEQGRDSRSIVVHVARPSLEDPAQPVNDAAGQ